MSTGAALEALPTHNEHIPGVPASGGPRAHRGGATRAGGGGLGSVNDRRRMLLLSVLSATLFWYGVDWFSGLYEFADHRFLTPIPGAKRLLLIACVAGVFYTTARALSRLAPRRPNTAWGLALVILFVSGQVGLDLAVDQIAPLSSSRPHRPLRLAAAPLTGTAWWNFYGGECGYFGREVVVFESETEAVRYRYGAYVGDFLYSVYLLLDVWPHGEWVERGVVREGVIYWDDGDIQRLSREKGRLRLSWAHDMVEQRDAGP